MSEFSQYIYIIYCSACDYVHMDENFLISKLFQWKLLLAILKFEHENNYNDDSDLGSKEDALGTYYMLGTVLGDLRGLFLNPC